MSTEYSEVIEFEDDHYPDDSYSPVRAMYKARLAYHHTSDTVTFQLLQPGKTEWLEMICLSDPKFGALVKLCRGQTLLASPENDELAKYKAGVEAVLGTVEREKKRADQALMHPKHDRDTDFEMYCRCSAQSHQAGRILSNVRYAFANAGLPVSKQAGEPKLLTNQSGQK